MPIDSDLRRCTKGKSKRRADVVINNGFELLVGEVSVASEWIASQKPQQLEEYVTGLSRSSGIPERPWPTSALWRRVGTGACMVRVAKRGDKTAAVIVFPSQLRYESLTGSGLKTKKQLVIWCRTVCAKIQSGLERSNFRVVLLTSSGLEGALRTAWGVVPGCSFIVLSTTLSPLSMDIDRRSVVGNLVRNLAKDVGLRWPLDVPFTTSRPGPLRVRGILGVFDLVGTAYPITVRSLSFLGKGRIRKMGAGVLMWVPKFISAWKRMTAKQRRKRVLRPAPGRPGLGVISKGPNLVTPPGVPIPSWNGKELPHAPGFKVSVAGATGPRRRLPRKRVLIFDEK